MKIVEKDLDLFQNMPKFESARKRLPEEFNPELTTPFDHRVQETTEEGKSVPREVASFNKSFERDIDVQDQAENPESLPSLSKQQSSESKVHDSSFH